MDQDTTVVTETTEVTTTGDEVTTPPVETKTSEVVTEEKPKLVPLAALEDERRKRQALEARIAASTPAEPERHFHDDRENQVFASFLKDPVSITREFNEEIRQLAGVIPEDGADEYRKAQQRIAYLRGVREQFVAKKMEIGDRQRDQELAEVKLQTELGKDAPVLLDFAKEQGISEKEFRGSPAIRAIIKTAYLAANPGKGKEVKPTPQKASTPSGAAGGGGGGTEVDEFDPKLTTEQRIELGRKRRAASGGR
jgi:hypothetical protein